MSTKTTTAQHATEAVRLLAAAVGAARLYPSTSSLPAEATARFVACMAESVAPVQLTIDPHSLRAGDVELAESFSQARALAETLHALQVGELIVTPAVRHDEATAFVTLAIADPVDVRAAGGPRAALKAAGCQHIAVVEVSLRSNDSGELGEQDVTAMPLDDIAAALPGAAERWVASADTGDGRDEITAAIGRMEAATQSLGAQRIADAIMRLDEETRMRVLASSLRTDANGRRMQGMLDMFSKMKPAALARLLTLTAERSGTEPSRIAGVLDLPPETLSMLQMLLAPTPVANDELMPTPEPSALAERMAEPEDPTAIARLRAEAQSPSARAGRALATAVAVSRTHPDVESVRTIGETLPSAACAGAFGNVREALRRLRELAEFPALTREVDDAVATLQRPEVLRAMCLAPTTDADAAIAGEILSGAGQAGAEAMLDSYLRASENTRALLQPTLRTMSQPLLGIASRRLRGDDPDRAVSIVRLLPRLGDSRAVPTMQQGLEHLDIKVRRAAVTALAETPSPEARAALARAVGHWDPTTQRHAIREIGRVRAVEAIPVMTRTLDDINPFARSHELKKEIVMALGATGSPEALPILKRVASRRVAMGRKDKELRLLAQQVAEKLERQQAHQAEGVDRP